MRHLLFAVLALTLAVPAIAAVSPPGVNIRWDNCFDDGGATNKTFACDMNAGKETLVLSFVLDAPMTNVSGMEFILEIASASSPFPAWWSFKNYGTCRLGSLEMALAPPVTMTNCLEWAPEAGQTGHFGYTIGYSNGTPAPDRAMIYGVSDAPSPNTASLNAGDEYFVMSLVIDHSKTVGPSPCAGCSDPVCIVFQSLNIVTPVSGIHSKLINGAHGSDSQIATWQSGSATNVVTGCSPIGQCITTFDCTLATPVQTRGSTWGAVKSLYR